MQMPVPSSYNDITTSSVLRDHVGPVWYEKTFFVPSSWRDERIFLRFGSINYLAEIVCFSIVVSFTKSSS
jgi:beta-glucuronidase